METINKENQFEYRRLRGKHLALANSKLPDDMEGYLDIMWRVGAIDELGNEFFEEQRMKQEARIQELHFLIHIEQLLQVSMKFDAKLVDRGLLFGFKDANIWKIWHRIQYQKSVEAQKKYERELKRIEYIPKNVEINLDRVREYPIVDLIQVNKMGFANCIFHDEKSASMKVYKDNHFHCFGCAKTGDVIDVAMQLWGTDFINTIKRLA